VFFAEALSHIEIYLPDAGAYIVSLTLKKQPCTGNKPESIFFSIHSEFQELLEFFAGRVNAPHPVPKGTPALGRMGGQPEKDAFLWVLFANLFFTSKTPRTSQVFQDGACAQLTTAAELV